MQTGMYVQCTGPDLVIITFPNYTVCLNIDNHLAHAFYSTFDFNLFIGHQVIDYAFKEDEQGSTCFEQARIGGCKNHQYYNRLKTYETSGT